MAHRRRHAARGLPFLMSAVLVTAWSVVIVGPVLAAGSVSLTTLGATYTENFNGLISTGSSSTGIPTGWAFAETGSTANTFYTAGTGSSGGGDTYSFGTAGTTERAFGGLRSGTLGGLVPTIGAQFGNNTGATITSLAIAYMGEQWRLGQNTAGRAPDRLDFQLSTDAISLTSGTWTDVDSLDFSSPVIDGTVGALDGNVAPNRTALAFTINGLSIAAGATVWIRWADSDLVGLDDGLAVDDFSLTPDNSTPEVDLSVNDVSQPEGDAGTTTFDFTVSLSAPAGAGGVTFDIATADDTATVNEGDYAAVALTGQTIPPGSSTYVFSVPVNGDTASEPDETFLVNVTNVTGATVVDGQGQATIANDEVPNAPPTVDAGGPYTAAEGGSVSLTATGSDPNRDALTYAWDLDDNGSYETAGQSVTFSAALLDGPTSATVHVLATDPGGLSATSPATIGITNEAPAVDPPSVAPEPSTEGEAAVASATFGDPAPADTFSCTVSYGDGSLAVAGSIVGATCTGPSHAYAALGTYTVTVSVTDDDGGTGSATTSHEVVFNEVVFDFGGFNGPVDNPPLLNSMNSGAAVPIMFTLGGDKGLAILEPGYPTSLEVTCDAADPVDTVEVTVTGGQSGLSYDPSTDQYTYVWKTKRSWAGTCRLFTLRLVDGTSHQALFLFNR